MSNLQKSKLESRQYPRPAPLDDRSQIALIAKLKSEIDFFSEMTGEEVVQLLQSGESESFEAGEVIFRKGERGESFYLLLIGEVGIRINGRQVAALGVGDCFGEMSVLEDRPRTATAIASEKTVVLRLNQDVISGQMMGLSRKVLTRLAAQISGRIRKTNELIEKFKQDT